LTGETAATTERIKATTGGGFRALVTPEDPECLHARWLTSEVPAAFNESVYYPYTSLQYHVLLTAALLHNYRARHAFEDLFLVATTPDVTPNADAVSTRDPKTALAADAAVEPHRTVLWTPETLHVTATPGDRPAARLGDVPARVRLRMSGRVCLRTRSTRMASGAGGSGCPTASHPVVVGGTCVHR